MMDPLHFCVAVMPLAVYLILIGILNLRRRAFVTTGARDCAALAIAVVGMMFIGPMKLFFPEGAASRFGLLTWLMMLTFYGLCVSLIVLLMRSRIVIYNMTPEHIRPVLTNLARRLDPGFRWTGDALWLPNQKLHLHVEPVAWLRNVELTAGGNQQSYEAWRRLQKELDESMKKMSVTPNIIGLVFVIAGLALATGAITWMLFDQQSVRDSLRELLMM